MKNLWSILLVAGLAFGCGSDGESEPSEAEESAETTTAEVTDEGEDEAEGEGEGEGEAEPSDETAEVATEADYEVAAIDEITPDNLQEHVERLEAAIAEDLGDDDDAITEGGDDSDE